MKLCSLYSDVNGSTSTNMVENLSYSMTTNPWKQFSPKASCSSLPRIQRFFLRLQKYNFTFKYTPGKTMKVADALSRASLDGKPEIPPEDTAHHVHSIINHLPVSQSKLTQLQRETANNPVLQTLKRYTINGWPRNGDIDSSVKPFFNQRNEIVHNHDLPLKGQQIIVPKSVRSSTTTLVLTFLILMASSSKPSKQSKNLKKAQKSSSDPYLSMLVLNTTPGDDALSPAFKMYHWNHRTTLPSGKTQSLSPPSPRKKIKQPYDHHLRDLSDLQPASPHVKSTKNGSPLATNGGLNPTVTSRSGWQIRKQSRHADWKIFRWTKWTRHYI